MKVSWKMYAVFAIVIVFGAMGTMLYLSHTVSRADSEVRLVPAGEQEESSASGAAVESEQETVKDEESSADAAGDDEAELAEPSGKKPDKKGKNKSKNAASAAEEKDGYRLVEGNQKDSEEDLVWKVGSKIAHYAQSIEIGSYVVDKGIGGYALDSAGFVKLVFAGCGANFQLTLPDSCREQAKLGREVELKDCQPGDVIFYGVTDDKITHCGIYLGENQVIHATKEKGVVISDMNYRRIVMAKRMIEAVETPENGDDSVDFRIIPAADSSFGAEQAAE
ncbi:MAG: C40 family peptidase [Lachnospiraceae bacterium]|nr:C40 family peptidase [Lachnospiraceae bacterium]